MVALYRIDRDVSDANTNVYGERHTPFPIFSSFEVGGGGGELLRQASENMEGAMKKLIRQFTPYSVSQVHDPLLLIVTPFKI